MKTETDMLLDDFENQVEMLLPHNAPENVAEKVYDRAQTLVAQIAGNELDPDRRSRFEKLKYQLANPPERTNHDDDDDADPFDDRF